MSTRDPVADNPHPSDDRSASDSIDITRNPLNDSTWLSPADASASTSVAGHFLPGYEILRELHRGGQGIVFLAHQKSVQRNVAVKVMKQGPFADPTDRARFEREVQILARLKHPNIVTIHDSGRVAGCDYFVMDYIAGTSLDEYVEQHKPPLRRLLELFQSICETVEVAHAHNIIHRDLKPGNIRVDVEGRPHILDFGLAKVVGAPRATAATEQGMFVGSIPWASPEQARGELETLDPRTDVYSLGVILYQLLTGRFPYEVLGPPHDVLDRIIAADPLPPRVIDKHIDRDLSTIVLKCLAKEEERRYASAGALASDLRRFLHGDPITARRESSLYRVRRGLWRSLNNQLPIWLIASLLTATSLAFLLIRPLVFEWTPINQWFRRHALSWSPSTTAASQTMERCVRVIALTPRTEPEALARANGISGVRNTDLQSLRRLHGEMMNRLAAAKPGAVVWDIKFRSESPYDADFVKGARKLTDAGIDVVVAVPDWSLDAGGYPTNLSPTIARATRWGCVAADMRRTGPWTLELVHYRPGKDVRSSLALLGAAALRHPRWELGSDLDAEERRLYMSYWKPDAASPYVRTWADSFDVLDLTSKIRERTASSKGDLEPGDVVGILGTVIPQDDALNAATLDYADVWSASDQQRRDWLRGKLVLFGDKRSTNDLHPYHDGRDIYGVYAQAVAIGSILSSTTVRTPENWTARLATGLAATLGVLIASLVYRRLSSPSHAMLTTLLALLAVAALALFASFALFRARAYLFDPAVPIMTAWVAAFLAMGVYHVRARAMR